MHRILGHQKSLIICEIQFFLNDFAKSVILIDDVLFTGRSVTAALAALQSFGRPKKVELLSLCLLYTSPSPRD